MHNHTLRAPVLIFCMLLIEGEYFMRRDIYERAMGHPFDFTKVNRSGEGEGEEEQM